MVGKPRMRDLLRLAVGMIIAASGFALIADGDLWTAYRVRDGLIVATVGALLAIFALPARPSPSPLAAQKTWPQLARTLTLTGSICSLAAALLLTWLGTAGLAAQAGGALWGVGLLLLGVGLFWPGKTLIYPAPAYRWRLDAAGRLVRQALGHDDVPGDVTARGMGRAVAVLALLALAVGVWLRMRQLTSVPATCVGSECDAALHLVEGLAPAGLAAATRGLHEWGARLLLATGSDSLAALRWSAVLLGGLALPVWLWAARPFMRRAGMLLGLVGIALLPWAVWTSRVGSAWIAFPLLSLFVLGAAAHALARPSRGRWGVAGLGFGLLLLQPTTADGWSWLTVAYLLWLLVVAILAGWQARRAGQGMAASSGVLVGSALAVALPVLLPLFRSAPPAWEPATGAALLAGLLQRGGAPLELFRSGPLLPAWLLAAAWIGVLALLWGRLLPRGLGVLLLSGWLLPGIAILVGGGAGDAAAVWLVWLTPLLLLAALTADALVTQFAILWARLIPPPRVVAVATLLLVVALLPAAWGVHDQSRRAGSAAQSSAAVGMARYLARCISGAVSVEDGLYLDDPCRVTGDAAPIFLVPPAVLSQPATRLLLSQADAAARIRALDPGRDLIPADLPSGDLIFLVGLDNQPLIELLPALYPAAEMRVPAALDADAGPTTFVTVRIGRAALAATRGLLGDYYAGPDSDDLAAPAFTRRDGAADFAWSAAPPLDAPFHARWEATLIVPEAGAYHFAIAGEAAADAGISLTLDGRIVLDTSLDLVERRETLAQGPAHLVLHYRGASPPRDWAVAWAREGEPLQPIPARALLSPPMPELGLLGTYHSPGGEGATLALRKDMILGADPGLDQPYRVQWQGSILAPRAGEYLFAVTANGPVSLAVNYRTLIDYAPPATVGEGPAYAQGSLYLPAGRHAIDIGYVANGPTELRLLWQAPGSAPALLPSRYLAPRAPDALADLPLPAPPPLVDARLGDESFALTAAMDMDQPLVSLPPESLPLLLAEQVWATPGVCGEDVDRLNSPRGIAIDEAANRIYVADALNRRIAVLDLETGLALTTLHPDGLEEPVDVALESSGALLVLDALTQTLVRVDPATGEGAPLALGTSFYRPRGFTVDATGNIGVADTGGARVVLLDSAGMPFAQFGGQGTVLGTGQPVDVVTVNGEWWAISAENGRLWRLDGLGSLPALPRTNTLTGPQLAALPDGAFFLSDPARRSVVYFAPNGRPLAQLGYADAFLNPMGVAAVYRDGFALLAVSDSAACSVSLWRLRPA